MARYSLIVIFLLKITFDGFTQINPPKALTFDDYLNPKNNIDKQECYYLAKFPIESRQKIYPFSNAQKVLIVSFDPVTVQMDDSAFIEIGGLPMMLNEIDYKKFKEIVYLTKDQIDTLSSILYNYSSKGNSEIVSHLACDCPCRNAILFETDKGSCFAYIGICFEYHDFFVYPENVETGDFCIGKYELLKDFFKINGIKMGVN